MNPAFLCELDDVTLKPGLGEFAVSHVRWRGKDCLAACGPGEFACAQYGMRGFNLGSPLKQTIGDVVFFSVIPFLIR